MHSPASEPPDRNASPAPLSPAADDFFVVAVGASAGGLEAISELLQPLPTGSDLAVIVVQHLDPTHASLLVELLSRAGILPVQWATDGCKVERGHIYVGPPGQSMSLRAGRIHLTGQVTRFPDGIDSFWRMVAEQYAHRAVGIILSGSGSDGALGVRAIKGGGGIVFAQEPTGAQFDAMPRAAIATGCVDRVLPPRLIGVELAKLANESRLPHYLLAAPAAAAESAEHAELLATLLRFLATRTGVDFSLYKSTTIKRRLVRSMMVAKQLSLSDYFRYLQKDRDEITRLLDSMLINVTEFFRDADYFSFLESTVVPEIVRRHAEGSPIRIWVPGCSTGEEAYSFGMICQELVQKGGRDIPIQIFGTDVSESAIVRARSGIYSAAEVAGLSAERRRRFFHRTDRGYTVQKPLRDICIFARQNVIKDSPFSRLDLLSCRNLLIYLNSAAQKKLMSIFHYALGPDGVLMLGHSESIGGHTELFRIIDRRFRLYARRATSHRAVIDLAVDPSPIPSDFSLPVPPPMPLEPNDPFDAIREADRIVAVRRGPPGIVVNDDLQIVQFRGEVMPYLTPVPGRATLKLLDMLGGTLAMELQVLMEQAREQSEGVQKGGLSVMHDRNVRTVTIDVTPFLGKLNSERFFLIEFTSSDTPVARVKEAVAAPDAPSSPDVQVGHLRQELQTTRTYLRTTVEKHELMNQALRSANEEIQSSNEELQSTNEELETAKEELQSTNEELSTVNEELHHRHVDLIQANNDLSNLISSVQLPILILGQDLRIRRFTPAAEKVFNLIPTDVGRPVTDINTRLPVKDLPKWIADTIESLTVTEFQVQDSTGHWYSLRLRPYKTSEQKIDGVVLTLVDIDEIKHTLARVESARDFERAVFETTREPLAALDADLRIKSANAAFYQLFNLEREMPESRLFLEVANDHGQFAEFRKAMLEILSQNTSLTDYPLRINLSKTRPLKLTVNARQIVGDHSYPLILLSLQSTP